MIYTVEQFAEKWRFEGDELAEVLPFVTNRKGLITTASIRRGTMSFKPDPGADGSWVYFIHAPKLKLVKIGYSVDPESRLKSLRTGIPVEMKIIGKVYGGRVTEAAYHKKFKKQRVSGEWFRATKFLLLMVSHFDEKPALSEEDCT